MSVVFASNFGIAEPVTHSSVEKSRPREVEQAPAPRPKQKSPEVVVLLLGKRGRDRDADKQLRPAAELTSTLEACGIRPVVLNDVPENELTTRLNKLGVATPDQDEELKTPMPSPRNFIINIIRLSKNQNLPLDKNPNRKTTLLTHKKTC